MAVIKELRRKPTTQRERVRQLRRWQKELEKLQREQIGDTVFATDQQSFSGTLLLEERVVSEVVASTFGSEAGTAFYEWMSRVIVNQIGARVASGIKKASIERVIRQLIAECIDEFRDLHALLSSETRGTLIEIRDGDAHCWIDTGAAQAIRRTLPAVLFEESGVGPASRFVIRSGHTLAQATDTLGATTEVSQLDIDREIQALSEEHQNDLRHRVRRMVEGEG